MTEAFDEQPDVKTVAIVGGGIAGLTVAHELAKNPGFRVCLFEQNEIFGGKARSVRVDGNPGEHAMRVYLASYNSLYHIMKEIPFGDEGKRTYDNLEYPRFTFRFGELSHTLSAKYTGIFKKISEALAIFRFVHRAGVPYYEIVYFLFKVGRLLWTSPGRIERDLTTTSFESYIGAVDRSQAFNDIVLRISEMLVAAKRTSSARVVSRILLEWYIGPFLKSPFPRLGFASLDGPTSEHFIDPWVKHLQGKDNIELNSASRVTNIAYEARALKHLDIDGPNGQERVSADYYVFAVQHNILDALLGDELERIVPELADLRPLGEEWSTGVQFFLKQIPEDWSDQAGRITIAIESPWALVFMINRPGDGVWNESVSLPEGTAGVLTLVASNSRNPGLRHKKPLVQCTKDEFLEECFEQLLLPAQPDLNKVIHGGVRGGYIGPDMKYLSRDEYLKEEKGRYAGFAAVYVPASKQVVVSDSLLYVRRPGNLQIEPANYTSMQNLYVAGEFTRTYFSTPTMEKSCESGMRCAKALFSSLGETKSAAALEPRVRGSRLPLAFLTTVKFRIALVVLGTVGFAVFVWMLYIVLRDYL